MHQSCVSRPVIWECYAASRLSPFPPVTEEGASSRQRPAFGGYAGAASSLLTITLPAVMSLLEASQARKVHAPNSRAQGGRRRRASPLLHVSGEPLRGAGTPAAGADPLGPRLSPGRLGRHDGGGP